jgi:anti-anti-sigma factor
MSGTRTVLYAQGDVDLAQADRLSSAWWGELDECQPDLVVVDLSRVTSMDMAGVRVIAGVIQRQRARGGSVGISNASKMIMWLLRSTSHPSHGGADDGEMTDQGSEAEHRSAEAWGRAKQAQERAREARERSVHARERGEQLGRRMEELQAGAASSGPTLERSAEAAREAARAAERAEQLAAEGYEHAAKGKQRASDAHQHLADLLELRAETIPDEHAEELIERAHEHRARAAADGQDATVDRDTARELRDDAE